MSACDRCDRCGGTGGEIDRWGRHVPCRSCSGSGQQSQPPAPAAPGVTEAGTDFSTWWRPALEELAAELTAEVLRLRADLAAVLRLCVRDRAFRHPEVPAAERYAVELSGRWAPGYPTREAAEAAILGRARARGGAA